MLSENDDKKPMFARFFGFTLPALLLLAAGPARADGTGASCLATSAAPLASQTRNLCQVQCALETRTGSSFAAVSPAPAACVSTPEEIERQTGSSLWSVAASCAGGAWGALVENLVNLLAPEEYRKFVTECRKDTACRRGLARQLDLYRARDASGAYRISDAELDKIAGTLDFNELLTRSRHNEGVTMDLCHSELAKITRRLSHELSMAEGAAGQQAVLQKRYDQLAAFDADCPRLIHLDPPGQAPPHKPLRALRETGQRALQGTRALGASIENWFRELGIAYQCYDGETRAELLCHALGQALLDPTAAAVGSVFAARALARIGRPAAVLARAPLAPLREARITSVAEMPAGMRGATESYIAHFDDGSRAIFKPCTKHFATSCRAEVLAYDMDQRLGLGLVPETVSREVSVNGAARQGSLQRWAEDARSGSSLRARPSQGDLNKQEFFDYLIRNIDRRGANYLVEPGGRVRSIDHGYAFRDLTVPADRSGTFTTGAQDFLRSAEGRQVLEKMRSWSPRETRAWLRQQLSPSETENTMRRIEYLRQYNPDAPNPSAAPLGQVRERTLQEILKDH